MDLLGQNLIAASALGTLDDLISLIGQGAAINHRNDFGETPLYVASNNGRTENVLFLIAAGADVHARSKNGSDALRQASGRGLTEAVFALIAAGSDVNAKCHWGSTALHLAAFKDQSQTALVLMGACANVNALDVYGQTPLDHSFNPRLGRNSLDCKATCLALISYGGKGRHRDQCIHESNADKMTMRQAAVQGGLVERLRVLLEEHRGEGENDTPEALVKYAHHHSRSDMAAIVQAHMAARAIDQVLQSTIGARAMAHCA